MADLTKAEYYDKVAELAEQVIIEAMEQADNDIGEAQSLISDILFESVDSSQYAIYTYYHLPIIQYSANAEYYTDNFGCEDAGQLLAEKGLSSLHATMAFWAFYADVQDKISELDFEQVAGLVIED